MTPFATYGLAALCFAALILWRLRKPIVERHQRLLLIAYVATAAWAWTAATMGVNSPQTVMGGTLRYLSWLALLHSLTHRASANDGRTHPGLNLVFIAVAIVLAAQLLLNMLVATREVPDSLFEALAQTSQLLRIITASGGLIIIHNLYGQAAPSSRSAIRLPMLALAMLWAFDLNLFTFAYLGSPIANDLFVWRGLVVATAVPLFAISDGRDHGWRIRLSRAATFQSLSLLTICAYLTIVTIVVYGVRASPNDNVKMFVVGTTALLVLIGAIILPSARARSWIKIKLAKHFFEHRYDYRSEWLRFTETIGRSAADALPLGERVVKAFADIVEAPGGLLLVADDGVIDSAASWNWTGSPIASGEPLESPDFWRAVEREGRIVDLDACRGGWSAPRDRDLPVPGWMLDDVQAWIGIPLIHRDRLIGIVVLGAPTYRRALDWEDFDLLRTAGRQAASSLAEAHGQEALLNAQRFEEFNRRFAFILHDVKNLVSQLSLLTRNAERHADNAEFRSDMIATLKSSVMKMNELLARLAPQAGQRREHAEATPLRDLLSSAVAAKRRSHDVRLLGQTGLWAIADRLGLEQAVGHLVQNAIDASPSDAPVVVRVDENGGEIRIAIIDRGCGMDSEFVRHRLFQPFASTKSGGFGVGAFEARSLVAAMGGRLTVTSSVGRGSSFVIHLAAADAAPLKRIA